MKKKTNNLIPVSSYFPHMKVDASCYKKGCEKIKIPIILGEEEYFHPHFTGPGHYYGSHFNWNDGIPVKHFTALNPVDEKASLCCPKCGTIFSTVFIIGNYLVKNKGLPTMLLYESEGC